MANTFSQIYLHFVFAVKHRQNLIPSQHKEELHKYITGLTKNRKVKMLAVHCMPDHVHFFVSIIPATFIPDFVKEIKVETNEFINSKRWVKGKFSWQEGYGVFSYSKSQVHTVVNYIHNQERHHHKQSFKEEYHELLRKFDIPFEEKYSFDFHE